MTRPAVLLVEPDPNLRKELSEGLSRHGYEVVPAGDRDEGLRFAEGLGPSVIVSREVVPGFGDASILGELRRDTAAARVLVVLGHSAAAPDELPEEVLYLPTAGPDPRELVRRIRLVLVGWEIGLEPDAELRTLVGELSLTPLLEVIRGLGRALVSGRVLLAGGEVVLDRGEVIAATAGGARGAKAFCRLGVRRQGPFRVILGRPGVGREIESRLDKLIIRAIEDRISEPPSPKARIAVDPGPSFAGHDVTRFQRELLTEARDAGTVGALLDRLEATDGTILRELETLRETGALTVREPDAQVRVVTDSTSDLPARLAREHGIRVVPLTVRFGERTYRDGIDITPRQFYELLESEPEPPATSPPTPEELLEVYEELVRERDVISVHLSSDLSETVKNAEQAAGGHVRELQELREGADPVRVAVVDGRQVSLGLGLLAMFAARLARHGLAVEEIGPRLQAMAERIRVLFVVDTLEFLARHGRIGKARAWVGKLVGIKPILGVREGEVVLVDRVRGGRAAHPRMIELFGQELEPDRPVIAAVAHAKAPVWADRLKSLLENELRVEELHVVEMGPVVGTHAGPGAVGAALFQPTDEELELLRE
ncbi:MAG: DegV family protein [Acidobacteriota bacterium]